MKEEICAHKLSKIDSTVFIQKDGFEVKEVSPDAKLMIFYVTNLILLGKRTDALKTIKDFGKYYYDKDLSEANLRKLKGIAKINEGNYTFNESLASIKEFLKASIIFE
jgi:hypothetical protein